MEIDGPKPKSTQTGKYDTDIFGVPVAPSEPTEPKEPTEPFQIDDKTRQAIEENQADRREQLEHEREEEKRFTDH